MGNTGLLGGVYLFRIGINWSVWLNIDMEMEMMFFLHDNLNAGGLCLIYL